MNTVHDYSEGAVVWGSGALNSLFACVICGGGWVLLWCGLKLTTRCVGSGDSWEELWCKLRLAAACALPIDSWYKLQSDL